MIRLQRMAAVPAATPTTPADLDDLTLIEKAKQSRNGNIFTALWNGDISGYKSHSEADLALCNALAFWTNKDANRIDKLFRQSGLIMWPDMCRNGKSGLSTTVVCGNRILATCGQWSYVRSWRMIWQSTPCPYRMKSGAQITLTLFVTGSAGITGKLF